MSDKLTRTQRVERNVLHHLEEEYAEHGWRFSGCIPADDTELWRKNLGTTEEIQAAIAHLIEQGHVQQRNCQRLAYQLSPARRLELIDDRDLSDYWQLVGQGPGGDEYYEIVKVRKAVAAAQAAGGVS